MTREVLKHLKKQLENIGINYAFLRWDKEITYPYFIGEYEEQEPTIEDRRHTYTFRLTGFTRGTWDELEQAREKIESLFDGYTTILDNGSGLVITTAGAFPIPIDEGELKKIQINLYIREWRVN